MSEYLYKDLTYQIRRRFFDVQNELGVGFDEETYHQALVREFENGGIAFRSKDRIALRHRDILIRKFVLDFLIEHKVIVSLKCVPCDFLQTHYIQLFSELKLWQKQLGLLVNFGLSKVQMKRFVFEDKELTVEEGYHYVKDYTDAGDRRILTELRRAILFVAEQHGLGFGQPVVRRLIEAELRYQGINFEKRACIPVDYHGETVRNYRMRHLLIEKRVVLAVKALRESITLTDIARIQSYLKSLNLSIGLAVNFGKSKLEIKGVRAPTYNISKRKLSF